MANDNIFSGLKVVDLASFIAGPGAAVILSDYGADVVKVFPASALGGAKYLKALKAPLPQVELIPTGGVSLATATEFLEAGAFALGVGADLVNPKAIAEGRPESITESAVKYLALVRKFRESQAPTAAS